MTPAQWTWTARRNAPFLGIISLPYFDLRGRDQLMEVRLYPDQPGDAFVRLKPSSGAEGLSVVYTEVDHIVAGVTMKVPVSTVFVRIARATIRDLPRAGEVGDTVEMVFDHLIAPPGTDLLPFLAGRFLVAPGVSNPA